MLYRLCTLLCLLVQTPDTARLVAQSGSGPVFAPPSRQQIKEELDRYRALPLRTRLQFDRRLSRVLQAVQDPALQRIRDLAAEGPSIENLTEKPAEIPHFSPEAEVPEQFESGVAPARRPLPEDDQRLIEARDQIPLRHFLPELHREADYDLRTGQIVRRPRPDRAQRLENLLRGFAPETDTALARILSIIDQRSEKERARGAWFEHGYCDRDGNLFPGIRLYDAWTSGIECEVPDVDSFAWLRTVERRKGGEAYDKLYPKLTRSTGEERRFRELRHALALAFVADDAEMDPEYRLLVPRFHALLAENDDDVKKLAKLIRNRNRDQLIALVDDQIRSSPSGSMFQARESRRVELERMRSRIRSVTLRELARAEAGVRR